MFYYVYVGMANSPSTLEAYLALSGFFEKTSLTSTEKQVVYLARISGLFRLKKRASACVYMTAESKGAYLSDNTN